MDLKEEIELLERKVELLKMLKELQEATEKVEVRPIYIPYPVYPQPITNPWEYPNVVWSGTSDDLTARLTN